MRVKWNDVFIYLNNIYILHSKYVTHNNYYKSYFFPNCHLGFILNIKCVIFLLRNLHSPSQPIKLSLNSSIWCYSKVSHPLNKTALISLSSLFSPFSPSDALCSNQFIAHIILQAHHVLKTFAHAIPLPKMFPSFHLCMLRFYQFFKILALSCSISSFFTGA